MFYSSKVSRKLMLSGAALPMLIASAAMAQTSPDQTSSQAETVIVTGSLIARPDYETATPIVTVTPQSLKDSGQVTLQSGLAQMPQFSPATAGAGPFIGGSGQANVSLRGLGAQRNLVLLDGRRLLPSSSDGTVDINQLPQGIIQGVEVITGGASATYGSDAVSGVVNFKTRQNFEGLDISSSYGTTQTFGGSNYDVNAVGGINSANGKGNLLLAAEYTKVIKVHTQSIPFYEQSTTGVIPIVQGEYFGTTNPPSQAAINAYFGQFGAAPGSVPNTGQIGFNADGTLFAAGPPKVVNFEPLLDSQGRRLNDIANNAVGNRTYANVANVPLERWSEFARGTWSFGGGIQAYGQVLSTQYDSIIAGDGAVTNAGGQIPSIPVTNPFIPAALKSLLATRADPTAPIIFQKRFTDVGGYRTATNDNNIYQVIGGVSGVIGFMDDATWDIHASHGRTQTIYEGQGGVRVDLIQEAFNAADGGASLCAGGYNPFGYNAVSAACKQFFTPEYTNRTNLGQDELSGSMQGTLMQLPAGKLQIAAGADYRNISYKYVPDAPIRDNDVYGLPAQASSSGSSAVREVFGEALIPAFKDLPFIQELNVDLAYRYSDYQLSGGTNTYKGDVDWRVGGGIRLRGGYERAIRAPAVSELFQSASQYVVNRSPIVNGVSDPCDVRGALRMGANGTQVANLCAAQGLPAGSLGSYTTSNYQMNAVASGNPNLVPEKADTFTGGAVYQPEIDSPWFGNSSISVDYYNIRIQDAIGELDGNTIVNKCFNLDGSNPTYSPSDFFCGLIVRGSTGVISALATPFANLGGYKTSGVDFQADWTVDFREAGLGENAGSLAVNMVASYLNDFKTQLLPGTPNLEYGGTTETPLGPYPTWHSVSQFNYQNGNYNLGLRWRLIGAMEDSSIVANKASTIRGPGLANYFDLILGFSVPETDTRVSAVVSNLFARSPNQVGPNLGSTNAALYTPLGRTYLVTLDQNF